MTETDQSWWAARQRWLTEARQWVGRTGTTRRASIRVAVRTYHRHRHAVREVRRGI